MNTKQNNYDFPDVGCYIDESAGKAETLNERIISFAEDYGFTYDALTPEDDGEDHYQIYSDIADDAVSYLNSLENRSFMSWYVDDNSLYLNADVDSAREDVGFVSHSDNNHTDECDPDDAAYPHPDYRGEWLHVSDHGNATLYVRGEDGKDKEIWSVV